jgi:hypothetical protein
MGGVTLLLLMLPPDEQHSRYAFEPISAVNSVRIQVNNCSVDIRSIHLIAYL